MADIHYRQEDGIMALRTYRHRGSAGIIYTGTVDVRQAGCYWSVYVNGRRMVDRESFTVANRIADGIVKPGVWCPSEADEVAASIMAWLYRRREHPAVDINPPCLCGDDTPTHACVTKGDE